MRAAGVDVAARRTPFRARRRRRPLGGVGGPGSVRLGSAPDRRRARDAAAVGQVGEAGEYQLQAAITALQISGADQGTTDWEKIADLYGALVTLAPSPVVELNRAVAVGFAAGPQAGLELIRPLLADPVLQRYQPLQAAHADLLHRAGDEAGAARAYQQAIDLTANEVERAELIRRLQDD